MSLPNKDFSVEFVFIRWSWKEHVTVEDWMEGPAIVVPHLIVAVYTPLLSQYLHNLSADTCRAFLFYGQDRIGGHGDWQMICLFYSVSMTISTALSWFIRKNLENLQKCVLWLSRNNRENIAVIFGEENQFCIVYFTVNKMWILFKVQVFYFW